jgi:hypothetical protein
MKITKLVESPKLTKRYRIYLDNGEYFDFGLDGGSTYIDHKDKKLREAYWKRHYGNPNEHYLIMNIIPSPALFSSMLLWGNSVSLRENMNQLNSLFIKKYSNNNK